MIDLVSTCERTQLLDPTGKIWEQVIEHRTDPLTGTVASMNAALGEKAKAFLGAADVELLAALGERSRAGCCAWAVRSRSRTCSRRRASTPW